MNQRSFVFSGEYSSYLKLPLLLACELLIHMEHFTRKQRRLVTSSARAHLKQRGTLIINVLGENFIEQRSLEVTELLSGSGEVRVRLCNEPFPGCRGLSVSFG